ncbi:uncharacterized protein LOC109708724 [Ananas comosus]|uniref:Uncharacterized protein LOC109704084 n=1 Tax=Ananas comosus TaxID=4615 RepID=A0A6P5ERI8_ANACO|nr:uncharacterized protein LOC109704084 [Ananas comosus]XP_020086132.1 uncharacterized protein LOC109708724 [Ananas comosus]
MRKVKIECLFLALALVVSVLQLHSHRAAAAAAAAAELSSSYDDPEKSMLCKGDLKNLASSCKKCIKKGTDQHVDPAAPCCRTIQTIDMLCICQSIPPRFEKKIDMAKLAYVAAKCAKPIRSKTKCGSYTVPMI